MAAKQYLLRLTAFGSLGMFMFMSISGAWGMYPGDDQLYARCGMVLVAMLVDVAAIGFMICFYDNHEEGNWGDALVFLVFWIGLSSGAIWTAKGWVETQDFKAWFPAEVMQGILETDKKKLDTVQTATKHPMNKKERKDVKQAVADAKDEIGKDARKVAHNVPVKNWIKGNEVGIPTILLIIAHMSIKGLRSKRKKELTVKEQIDEAFAKAKDITPPAVSAPLPAPTPTPPPGNKTLPPPEVPEKSAEIPEKSRQFTGNVVDLAGKRKRKMPTSAEVAAMRAIDPDTGKPRYTFEEIAAHFGCSEKTCRNRMNEARRQSAMQVAA